MACAPKTTYGAKTTYFSIKAPFVSKMLSKPNFFAGPKCRSSLEGYHYTHFFSSEKDKNGHPVSYPM